MFDVNITHVPMLPWWVNKLRIISWQSRDARDEWNGNPRQLERVKFSLRLENRFQYHWPNNLSLALRTRERSRIMALANETVDLWSSSNCISHFIANDSAPWLSRKKKVQCHSIVDFLFSLSRARFVRALTVDRFLLRSVVRRNANVLRVINARGI